MTPIAKPTSVATPEFDRRRLLSALAAGTLVCVAAMLPGRAHAASAEEAVIDLQHDWEVIKYQTAQAQREARFEALADKTHTVSASYPGRAEPLIWEGIVVASWAGEKGGLGALGLVKNVDRRQSDGRIGGHRHQNPLQSFDQHIDPGRVEHVGAEFDETTDARGIACGAEAFGQRKRQVHPGSAGVHR